MAVCFEFALEPPRSSGLSRNFPPFFWREFFGTCNTARRTSCLSSLKRFGIFAGIDKRRPVQFLANSLFDYLACQDCEIVVFRCAFAFVGLLSHTSILTADARGFKGHRIQTDPLPNRPAS